MISESCPPSERLAAVLEGRATPAERREVLAHLGSCEDCYEVFTESAQLLVAPDDESRTTPAPVGLRGRPGGGVPPWLPLAAGLVLAAGLAAYLVLQIATRPEARGGPSAPQRETRVEATAPPPATVPVIPQASASPPARRPRSGETHTPAWIDNAPWNRANPRLGFEGRPASRATLLGMHLAALRHACALPAQGGRGEALGLVRRSLERNALVSREELARTLDAAAAGRCEPSGGAGREDGWLQLGEQVESWRIAVTERRAAGLSPALGRELAQSLEALDAGPALHRAAAELQALLLASPPADFDRVGQALEDLIELLCD